jgi:hypothetical protein
MYTISGCRLTGNEIVSRKDSNESTTAVYMTVVISCLQPKTDTPRPVKFKLFLLSCRPSNQRYQILSRITPFKSPHFSTPLLKSCQTPLSLALAGDEC